MGNNRKGSMNWKYGFFLVGVGIIGLVMFNLDEVRGFQEPPPPITFSESCTTTLILDSVPNGLAGFTVKVDVPVINAITVSEITVSDTNFPLQSVVPPQSMIVSGVDLGAKIEAGSSNVVLFSISPCIDSATILRLDDDNGDSIVPSGTEVFP